MFKHGTVRTAFPRAEADAVIVAIDHYIDGHDEAKALTAEDPSIDSPELLVDVANSYDNQRDLLLSAKQRLEKS